jgi:hypothetical protein
MRYNATSQLTETFTVQGSYFYRAPMKIERGKFAAFQGTNISLRKKINGDKAIVGLRFNDPFNTARMKIVTGNDQIIQLTSRNFGARSAWLTFQYNYGQAPKLREPRQEPVAPPPQSGFP